MINNKNRKIYKVFLSFFIALSIVFSSSLSTLSYGIGQDSIRDMFIQTLEEGRKEEGTLVEENLPAYEDIVTFIVELDEKAGKDFASGKSLESVAKNKDISQRIIDSQDYYKIEIKKINEDAVFDNQYTLLLNGFSVQTRYEDKEEIEAIEGVKKVTLAKTYYKDMKNSVKLTNVSKVWEEYGYDGRGKVVAVLDSGVDYNHKDMVISPEIDVKMTEEKVNEIKNKQMEKRGKYFTEKIPFGYNYADKNEDIIDRVVENIDYGHGMHVTGIIGANCQVEEEISKNNGLKGIAPEVQILAMKIFSNDPRKQGASEADIIAAIEDAVAYGADVINMSFCSTAGFQDSEDGQQIAIKEAINQGIIVVGAAGNVAYSTYPKKYASVVDTGTVGAPGIVEEGIQVASFENSTRTAYGLNATIGGETEIIPYVLSDFDPIALKNEYEIVDCGLGQVEDLKNIDLTNKIALIRRGIIEFKDKKLNAQENGAIAVILYNSDGEDGYLDFISTSENVKIPTIFISNSDGIKLSKMISQGLKVSFQGKKLEIPNIDNGTMSYFTSWGPTPNLNLKPDITSVGGTIWSTVNDNGYKNMSGTSMATPHTSGIMILLLEHLEKMGIDFNSPEEKVLYAKNMIMNTAQVKIDEKSGLPYSPRRQGAGLINAKNALVNKVLLTHKGQASIPLKEIRNNTIIPLTLENTSDKDITYKIGLVGGVLTEQNDTIDTMSYDVLLKDAELKFDTNEITVKAGETLNINGQLVIGDSVEQDIFVEGFIRFESLADGVPSIGLPFMGFYGIWDELKIVDEPTYKEGSVFKETSLFTAKPGTYGMKTYPLGGKNMNPEYFSINPEDKNANYNVLPQFSLLRNAKNIKIDVSNESGEILKIIEDRENMRKEVVLEQQIPAKVNFDWLWEGTVYDKALGEQKILEEGQYFINIRTSIDFENAKEQVNTFPIKIDKTSPIVKSSMFITDSNECIIEMEVTDKGVVDSGIENFLFLIDGKRYEDENGNFIFNLNKDENGKYKMKISLSETNRKPFNIIDIGVTDYADNMGLGKAIIVYAPSSNIKISTDKTQYNKGENIVVKYNFSNGSDEAKIDHYNVYIESLDKTIDNGKNLSYTIKEFLKEGINKIFIEAVDITGKVIDANGIEVMVLKGMDLEGELVIENLTNITSLKNGENVLAEVKAANKYKESKDITLMIGLYDEANRLVNFAAVEKSIESGKESLLGTSIKIPEKGEYKLKIFIWDNFNNMESLVEIFEI